MSGTGDLILKRLATTINRGAELLTGLTGTAARRIGVDGLLTATQLFRPKELEQLHQSVAGAVATGELVGRVRVLLKARQARKKLRTYAEDQFIPVGIHLFTPRTALEFFTKLVPELGLDVQRWGPEMERHAFTVAAATDDTILNRIRDVIIGGMTRGEPYGSQQVGQILERAGLSPKNKQYPEAIYRTNIMDAHATGHDREMADPAMQETFPAWLYSAAVDEHSRHWHAVRNDRMYDSLLPFALVRGTQARDVINCRCVPIDLDRWELEDRLSKGERLYTTIEG